jgi:hypothetical protein
MTEKTGAFNIPDKMAISTSGAWSKRDVFAFIPQT